MFECATVHGYLCVLKDTQTHTRTTGVSKQTDAPPTRKTGHIHLEGDLFEQVHGTGKASRRRLVVALTVVARHALVEPRVHVRA